jgi:hypothetical protein
LLDEVRRNAIAKIEQLDEDELLGRSTDDLVAELVPLALVGTLGVDSEPVDGAVNETTFEMGPDMLGRRGSGLGGRVRLIRTKGDRRLFDDQPSKYLLVILEGTVGDGELHVEFVHPGQDSEPERGEAGVRRAIEPDPTNGGTRVEGNCPSRYSGRRANPPGGEGEEGRGDEVPRSCGRHWVFHHSAG